MELTKTMVMKRRESVSVYFVEFRSNNVLNMNLYVEVSLQPLSRLSTSVEVGGPS